MAFTLDRVLRNLHASALRGIPCTDDSLQHSQFFMDAEWFRPNAS